MNRILIAEDEVRIASFIESGLQASGFDTVVVECGVKTLGMADSRYFDLLILDLTMPGKDGLAVLSELRGRGERLPVIILTARDDMHDKLAGLEGGADDYMTKPFRFEELLARIRLRLRDVHVLKPKEATRLQCGDIVMDLPTHRVSVAGKAIDLSAREFLLAETFLRHAGQVLSREQLLSRVWGYSYDPGSNIVDVYVAYLRKKLGGKRVETVRGIGYRLRVSPLPREV